MKNCKGCGHGFEKRENERPDKFRRRLFCCMYCARRYNVSHIERTEPETPTVEEIAVATAAIRSGWNERDYYIRSRYMLGDHLKWKRNG